MDFSGIGGIAIVIIAGLWLLVFVPSRVRGNVAEEQLKSISKTAEPIQPVTKKQQRLAVTALVSTIVSVLAFAASIALLVLAQITPFSLYGLIASGPIAIGGLLLSAAARATARRQATRAVRRPAKSLGFDIETDEPVIQEQTIRDRSWTPVTLPAPLANRPGELRRVAPVVSFESAKVDAEAAEAQKTEEIASAKAEIDVLEILRRRRAI